MNTIAYSDWKKKLRAEIWPYPGEPKSLRPIHDSYFNDAMIDLGKWVECLNVNHTSVIPWGCTMVECAKTLLTAPIGVIKRLYTIANNDWCNKVQYRSTSFNRVECMASMLLLNWTGPGGTAVQQGILQPNAASDSPCGRSRTGYYAIRRKRLYLAPWIQSNEAVVIEWDGYKVEWLDTDMLDQDYWTKEVEAAVKCYLRWQHKQNHSEDVLQAKIQRDEYIERRADLMYWCEQRIKERENEVCCEERLPTSAEIASEEIVLNVPVNPQFAIVGDEGSNDATETNVANRIKTWDPLFIVTTGDNRYDETKTWEDVIGEEYGDYITDDLTTNRFWPALGNHDWDTSGTSLNDWLAYFTLPNNERFYTFRKGPVQFFVIDTDSREEQGITSTSKQAEWLRIMLAMSTAPWKIVIGHHPPYSSRLGSAPGITDLRWPYAAWGADAYINGHGHQYERVEVDGFPYITNGFGGQPTHNFDAPIDDPQNGIVTILRYNEHHGAMRCIASPSSVRMQFVNWMGDVIDDFYLRKSGTLETLEFTP